MRRKLRSLLSLAGLNDDEIQLYLLLLKLRKASVSELIEKSKLNTMTAYRVIKRLQDRELIKATPINSKQCFYEPLSLAALIKRVDTEQRKLRRLQLALEDLDHLLPFTNVDTPLDSEEEELIEVREGLDAFREEYLRFPDICEEEYIHMGDMDHYWRVAGLDYEAPEEKTFRAKRFRKGIYCRIINVHSQNSDEFKRRDSIEMRTSKITNSVPIKDNYLGLAEKQATHFLCDEDNPRAIVIRQPELVAWHHEQFSQLWSQSQ